MTVGVSAMTALRSSAVGDWEVCGDSFFSRELLYEMAWGDVELENMRVCCSPFGGPIALIQDERRMVVVTSSTIRPVVRIFTAAGRQLGSMVWDKGRLVDWGWSCGLELLLVDETGRVVVLSMHGERVREFSMGAAVEKQGVSKALVCSSGVVVLTQPPFRLWAVDDLLDPRPLPLAPLPQSLMQLPGPSCMAVLEPRFTSSGALEVLVGGPSGVCQLDDASALEHSIPGAEGLTASGGRQGPSTGSGGPQGPSSSAAGGQQEAVQAVRHLAVSPDGSFVAVYTQDAHIHVFSADFTKQLSVYDTQAEEEALAVVWCGSDAVVVQWPELLLVVGPFGDHASWALAGDKLLLVQEVDGLRLLGAQLHELLRKVPRCLADVQRPGSTAPAAQLWDARDLFEQHNARADRTLRALGAGELRGAVADCVEAAGLELSPARQKALLRAACFGAAFCPPQPPAAPADPTSSPSPPPPTPFYDTCCKLRVLNALREPSPGLPLTLPQLEALSLPAVVDRLVAYHEWLLAYRIAGTLQQRAGAAAPPPQPPASPARPRPASKLSLSPDTSPQEQVLLQWACAKISAPSSSGLPDQELKDQIAAKLKACPGVHFAPLAAHAQAVGRSRLALKLLEEESSCSLQVPLLLSLSVATAPAAASQRERERELDGLLHEDGDTLLRALRKSIESGDTDLVYLVLFHVYRHRSLAEFWAIISSRTLARNLFTKFCRAREPELLETLLTLNNQLIELAEQQLRRCLAQYNAAHAAHAGGDTALLKLTSGLSDVAAKYGTSRDHVFQAKAATEFAQLRREQARLERETGQHLFVGLSLVDTLRACVRLGHNKQAAMLKKTFNISDKRFYWLKVLTLCEERNWLTLEDFGAERKSPIGWEPFLDMAKKYGAPREVQSRIISKLPDSKAKAELFTGIDCPREAAEVAAKLRDGDLLAKIQGLVPAASPAGLAIAQIRERFQATFR